MEVYLYSGRRSVSAVPPVRKRKMENTEHRSVSAVPPVCTRKMKVDTNDPQAVWRQFVVHFDNCGASGDTGLFSSLDKGVSF